MKFTPEQAAEIKLNHFADRLYVEMRRKQAVQRLKAMKEGN